MQSQHPPILIERLDDGSIDTNHGVMARRLYRGSDGSIGVALWRGDLSGASPVLGRIHSSCFTSEGLFALDCDCSAQLDSALGAIAGVGHGVVFYLLQEGRGAGLPNKARDRSIVQTTRGAIDTYGAYASLGLASDPRRYDLVKPICADLGITQPLTLMTNNPLKIAALAATGFAVKAREHELPASVFNSQYITAKAMNGHSLTHPTIKTATVPPGLDTGDPRIERIGGFARAASYGLPVWVGAGPVWLRATSYIHEATGHDRLVLSYLRTDATAIRHIYREKLEDRLSGGGEAARRYRAALERVVARGRGSILAVPSDPGLLIKARAPHEDEDAALLDGHTRALGGTEYEEVA